MKNRKTLLLSILSLVLVFSLIVPACAPGTDPVDDSILDSSSVLDAMPLDAPGGNVTPMVVAGHYYTVGLRSDGTVVAIGYNENGQCDVGDWSDIVQISASFMHTLGLKSDGAVEATGDSTYGQCDVSSWTGIVQIAAGWYHTVGLTSDGTVVAVGDNTYGQCDVGGWTDIVQVAAGLAHSVGLRSDGTVVAVGSDSDGECNIDDWTDIIQVAAGGEIGLGISPDDPPILQGITLGLKMDGTVVAVGNNNRGQCSVGSWTDIVQVTAGYGHTVGIKTGGTVVSAGLNIETSDWVDIVRVAAGSYFTIGLKSNGDVIAIGLHDYGQFDVDDWVNITEVAASYHHTVGLKSDGTAVAVGYNYHGQCDIGNWTDIVQVAVADDHTVGLKSNGTVVVVGRNENGECDVGNWTDIIQIAAGTRLTVGLRLDGNVVAVGNNNYEQCNVGNWTDISQVAVAGDHTVGLKSDGTVVAVGWNYYGQCDLVGWTDISQIATGHGNTFGLKFDSTVVAVGKNYSGQCDVGNWTDIVQIAAGSSHTLGVNDQHSVVSVGTNWYGQCNVNEWVDIIQVASGKWHTVGLKANGTVVAAGLAIELARWNLGETEPPPTEIYDWYDLDAIRDNLSGNYILMNDLDSTTPGYEELASPTANNGTGWEPIGTIDNPFIGTVDGQGYEIRDLFIDRTEMYHVGLFSAAGGVVENLGLVNIHVSGKFPVGGLAGAKYGTLNNCYVTGDIIGERNVGGLVGGNGGIVSNCYAICNVAGDRSVGGLMGSTSSGSVINSYYNYDDVFINGENVITVGALLGEDFEEWLSNDKLLDVNDRLTAEGDHYVINNVIDLKELLAFGQDSSLKFRLNNDLDLTTESGFYIPYLAGEFDGNDHVISNLNFGFGFVSCVGLFGYISSLGQISGITADNVDVSGYSRVGGIVGFNRGIVSNAHSSGIVAGVEYVGGLVGQNYGNVGSSGASVDVSGTRYVGGLVGQNYFGIISNSCSDVRVTGIDYVGGLVGYNDGADIANCHSTADVTGCSCVGGLVGVNTAWQWWYFTGVISKSYSTGHVSGNEYFGGLVGFNGDTCGEVSNSFWDMEASEIDLSAAGTGKNTSEMTDIATFNDTATEGLDEPWNIIGVAPGETSPDHIWNIVNHETYPFLSWESAPSEGIISGRVTDAATEQGIGAILIMDPDPLGVCPITDIDGYFSFSVPEGIYSITASAGGYLSETTHDVTVISGETTTVNFELSVLDIEELTMDYFPMLTFQKDERFFPTEFWYGDQNIETNPDEYEADEWPRTVYIHTVEGKGEWEGYLVIQYWFYYAQDFKLSPWELLGHDHDWESVFVLLDKVGAEYTPRRVTFFGHGDYHPYAWSHEHLVDRYQRMGTHTGVFVAEGSHASYPTYRTSLLYHGPLIGHPIFEYVYAEGIVDVEHLYPEPVGRGDWFLPTDYNIIYVDESDPGDLGWPNVFGEYQAPWAMYRWNDPWWYFLDKSWLVYLILSPVDALVIDADGRRIGFDHETDTIVNEIPGARYSGPGTEPQIITIPDILEGDYTIRLAGTDSGTYTMTTELLTTQNVTTFTVSDIPAAKDMVDEYSTDWGMLGRGEAGITISKDYDGDGVVDDVFITSIPEVPADPSPVHNATQVAQDTALSWVGDESETVNYDIYLGTDVSDLQLVSERQADTTYVPTLNPDTRYYWMVEAINEHGISSTGALWEFTTEASPSCFIATAAYGTPMAEEIQVLREFRDEYLTNNPLGQSFVDLYYRTGPPIAEFITDHPSLKPIVRAGLVPAVALSAIIVNTTGAQQMAVLGLLVLVSAAVAIWAIRRRERRPECG